MLTKYFFVFILGACVHTCNIQSFYAQTFGQRKPSIVDNDTHQQKYKHEMFLKAYCAFGKK